MTLTKCCGIYPSIAISLSRSLAMRLLASDQQRIYGVSEDYKRLIGVVGTPDETFLLAQRLAELGLHNVLLVDVIETGDECSTVDPSDPFHDVVALPGGVARMDVPVEVSSGDFSEIVSRLLQKYTHLMVRLPDSGGPYLAQVLDLCESGDRLWPPHRPLGDQEQPRAGQEILADARGERPRL